MSHLFTPEILVVPDGVDDGHLMLTVQVTPSIGGGGQGLDLERWPAEIAACAKNLRVGIADYQATPPVGMAEPVPAASALAGYFDGSFTPDGSATAINRVEAATRLWQRLFAEPGFDFLARGLTIDDNAFAPEGSAEGLQEPDIKAMTSATSDLARVLDTIAQSSAQTLHGAIKNRPIGDQLAIVRDWMGAGGTQRDHAAKAAETDAALHVADPFVARADELTAIESGLASLRAALRGDKSALDDEAEKAAISSIVERYRAALEPCPPDTSKLMEEDERVTAAKGKLTAIVALPSLAHYFGLAIQVRLPVAALGGRSKGLICVEFADVSEQKAAWTAFEFNQALDLFAPSEGDVSPQASARFPYRRGLIDLSVTIADSNGAARRRYEVDSRDVTAALQGLNNAKSEEPVLVDEIRRGIVLFDRFTGAALKQEIDDERQQAPDTPRVNHARDLLIGIRPDVSVAAGGGTQWRQITRRAVRCADQEEGLLDPSFYEEPAIKQIAHHDDGLAIVPEELKQRDSSTLEIVKQEELFSWAGESLALAATEQDEQGRPRALLMDTANVLGLTIDYYPAPPGETTARADLQPPLREDLGYYVGCRLVFANGCSRRRSEAVVDYGSPQFRIGDRGGNDAPYVFPPAFVPPPDIHLVERDRLVVSSSFAEFRGDALDQLVVRTADDAPGDARAVRLVFPPRIGFERGEAEGQFDSPAQRGEAIPRGAFAGPVHLHLFGEEGAFPEARLGALWHVEADTSGDTPTQKWTNIKDGSGKPAEAKDAQSRGTVAILKSTAAPATDGRYYASRRGRVLEADVRSVAQFPPVDEALEQREFWEGSDPNDALPIVLELVRSGQAGIAFNPTPHETVKIGATTLPHLRIDIGECVVADLALSAPPPPGVSDRKTRVLRLVHARQKPLHAPLTAWPAERPGTERLGINMVTVTVGKEEAGELPTWDERIREFTGDMLDWNSEEGGSTTFFTGRVGIDRPSTGAIRCVAKWDEHDERRVVRGQGDSWIERPQPRREKLFDVMVGAEGDPWIDLLTNNDKGGDQALREKSHAFADGRARRLSLTLTATSRFAEYFVDTSSEEALARCETASEEFEVWTYCTFRPPAPQVDRIVPTFQWTMTERTTSPTNSATRRAGGLRIHLKEGWYASGEGEQLAIILAQDGNGDPAFERFVTRAAADPVHLGNPERGWLTEADFPGAAVVRNVDLFLNDDPLGPGVNLEKRESMPVTIIRLTVEKDDFGALFAEVPVADALSHLPFLHLGLARYQEHAVAHLRLSTPIVRECQLLPRRDVTISGADTKREFRMVGAGYRMGAGQGAPRSTVHLRLVRWDADGKQWTPWPDELDPTKIDVPAKLKDDGTFEWRHALTLPGASTERNLALHIEEYEHLEGEEPTGTYQDGLAEFRAVPRTRLIFSHFQRIYRP